MKGREAMFQSHNGAIAAGCDCDNVFFTAKFQSHNGAIAARKGTGEPLSTNWFQSHNGAIAATIREIDNLFGEDVSIPQWCDCCLEAA